MGSRRQGHRPGEPRRGLGALVPPRRFFRQPLSLQARRFWEAGSASEYVCSHIVDCGGHVLAPGFLDLQFNGAWGVDFSNPVLTEEDVLVSRAVRATAASSGAQSTLAPMRRACSASRAGSSRRA